MPAASHFGGGYSIEGPVITCFVDDNSRVAYKKLSNGYYEVNKYWTRSYQSDSRHYYITDNGVIGNNTA
jgi:hypothetical protein